MHLPLISCIPKAYLPAADQWVGEAIPNAGKLDLTWSRQGVWDITPWSRQDHPTGSLEQHTMSSKQFGIDFSISIVIPFSLITPFNLYSDLITTMISVMISKLFSAFDSMTSL